VTSENDYEDTVTRHEYEHAYEYDARRYDYDARSFVASDCRQAIADKIHILNQNMCTS
jgi:hypothetical protein